MSSNKKKDSPTRRSDAPDSPTYAQVAQDGTAVTADESKKNSFAAINSLLPASLQFIYRAKKVSVNFYV